MCCGIREDVIHIHGPAMNLFQQSIAEETHKLLCQDRIVDGSIVSSKIRKDRAQRLAVVGGGV
jgi:hypothetical protein